MYAPSSDVQNVPTTSFLLLAVRPGATFGSRPNAHDMSECASHIEPLVPLSVWNTPKKGRTVDGADGADHDESTRSTEWLISAACVVCMICWACSASLAEVFAGLAALTWPGHRKTMFLIGTSVVLHVSTAPRTRGVSCRQA